MKKTKKQLTVKTQEFPIHEKSAAWFVIVTLAYSLIVAAAAAASQWLLVLILVLSAVVYYLLTNLEPKYPTFEFSKTGLTINKKTFDYVNFRWFRMFATAHGVRLELQPLNRVRLPVSLAVSGRNVDKILAKLAHAIPWNLKTKETLADRLARWLRI